MKRNISKELSAMSNSDMAEVPSEAVQMELGMTWCPQVLMLAGLDTPARLLDYTAEIVYKRKKKGGAKRA